MKKTNSGIYIFDSKLPVFRVTEDTVIKIPDLMQLKIELGGGFNTNPKYYFSSYLELNIDRSQSLNHTF